MTIEQEPPRLNPDGKPRRPRRTGDEEEANSVDGGEDPEITGDAGGGGYANTDDAAVTDNGLVRRGDQSDPSLI